MSERTFLMGLYGRERKPRVIYMGARPWQETTAKRLWRVQANNADHARSLIAAGKAEVLR